MKSIARIVCILVFITLVTSCQKKGNSIKYYYLTDISNPKIDINLKDSLENGSFRVSVGENNYVLGEFEKGDKIGDWFYRNGNQHDRVKWKNYQCEDGITSLQYPDRWVVLPYDNLTFQATFDTIPHLNSNYCFRIIRNKIIGGVDIVDYSKLLIKDLSLGGKVVSIQQSLLKNGHKEFVYSYLRTIRGSDTLGIMSLISIVDRKYFDVLYSTSSKNMGVKEQVFYDIISSIKVDNVKIINNLLPIKSYKITHK